MRSAECGVAESGNGCIHWLKWRFSARKNGLRRVTRIPDCDGRKKAYLGHYKKSFFDPSKNAGFLHFLKIAKKHPFRSINTGVSCNSAFFVFVPKRVKNRLKKNIVSNLP